MIPHLQYQIKALNNQVDSLAQQVERLQQKIIEFENERTLHKSTLSELLNISKAFKIDQHDNGTLKSNIGSYLPENDPKRSAVLSKVRDSTFGGKDIESKSFSEVSKIDFIHKKLDQTTHNKKQGIKLLDSEKARFKTPQEIVDKELTKSIKIGFQLNKDKKIPLKEYYEGTGEHSLYKLAGINIKFETIRQKDLYKELKKLT